MCKNRVVQYRYHHQCLYPPSARVAIKTVLFTSKAYKILCPLYLPYVILFLLLLFSAT